MRHDGRAIAALDDALAASFRPDAMLERRLAEGQKLAPPDVEVTCSVEHQVVEYTGGHRAFGQAEQSARRAVGIHQSAVVVQQQHRAGGGDEDGVEPPLPCLRIRLAVQGRAAAKSRGPRCRLLVHVRLAV